MRIKKTRECCTVMECTSTAKSRGLCNKHYLRLWTTGKLPRLTRPDGTGTIRPDGYVSIKVDGVQIHEHVWRARKALGKLLPPEAEVHHLDMNRSNNTNTNLVVCPNKAYHMLLHARQKQFGIYFK